MRAPITMSSLPTRSQLQNKIGKVAPSAREPEESLVDDERSLVGPAQMVERKLLRLSKNSVLFISHLLSKGLIVPRG
jgi:hypothetical protein